MSMRAGASRVALVAVFLIALCSVDEGFSQNDQRIVGSRGAHLRAAPSDRAFSVLDVRGGTQVTVVDDTQQGWIGVVAPQNAALWVYGDLIRNDRVIAPRMLVRAGPGIDYEGVGDIKKGHRVTIRGRQDDWVKILPPEGVVLWLKRSDIVSPVAIEKPQPEPQPKPEPKPDPDSGVKQKQSSVVVSAIPSQVSSPARQAESPKVASKLQPIRPTQGVKPSPVPVRRRGARPLFKPQPKPERADPKPDPIEWAGKVEEGEMVAIPRGSIRVREVTMSGRVKRAPIFPLKRYSKYRLVRRNANGQSVTAYYLLGPEDRLEALVGRAVEVSGTEYAVPEQRTPALALSAIKLAP
ncbi:MAG: SH3 domain-containing protein [Kiritimatiellae bacterium]|nr:SH3 domain-containing protein [Kiritimatiellia bacterium]